MTTTTTEQIEKALVAIQGKGERFSPLLPDRLRFAIDSRDVYKNEDLIDRLIDQLIERGYVVSKHSSQQSFEIKYTAVKAEIWVKERSNQPHD